MGKVCEQLTVRHVYSAGLLCRILGGDRHRRQADPSSLDSLPLGEPAPPQAVRSHLLAEALRYSAASFLFALLRIRGSIVQVGDDALGDGEGGVDGRHTAVDGALE